MNGMPANLHVATPLLVACGTGLFVLLAETFATDRRFRGVAWLTLLALGAVAWAYRGATTDLVFGGAIALDGFAVYFGLLICALAALAVMLSVDYLPVAGIGHGEFYPVLLFAVAGLLVMASATDLIVIFLGLETMSMAVYVLAGMQKQGLRSNEAALKYFLMGAFASAFLLYGIALVYAVAGSTLLGAIARVLEAGPAAGDLPLLQLGIGLMLVGFAFKVAAVPFHLWAPDVYEGSPTSVTAFMATAVKAGGFAALLRVALVALQPLMASLTPALWVISALTMTVGNFVALRQTSVKRMLAYSSIAHTGYLLVGVTAGTEAAGSAVLFYLACYGVMNIGAFGVLVALARADDPREQIGDLAGLGQRRPMLALVMTLCMLSLLGIPPLAGFMGKLYLFTAAVEAGFVWLALLAVANSVVSAAYYLGVVRAMYFEEGTRGAEAGRPYVSFALAAAAIATVWLGLAPGPVQGAAARAFAAVVLGP